MLKAAQCLNSRAQALPVAYMIFQGNLCVFSATESSSQVGSSINYAEGIIRAIAEAEARSIPSIRYFDLQTRTSYGWHPGSKNHMGEFELDEVQFTMEAGELRELSWCPTHCPAHVIEHFKTFIDGVPKQQIRHEAQRLAF